MSKSRVKSQRATVSGRLEGRKEMLAEAIGSWAREKLHLKEKSVPTTEELKLLLKDSSGIAMWDHLVASVHPPGHADTVKKNLQLHLGSHGNKGAELHVKRSEVGRELNSLELAISQMETEISRLQTGIGTLARENETVEQEMKEASQKRALLQAYHIKSKQEVKLLEEYARRIALRKECFSWPEQEPSYFSIQGRGVAGGVAELSTDTSRYLILESACKRAVREACELVKEVLDNGTLQSNPPRKEDLDKAKGHVWSKVETLHSAHTPGSVIQCLCEVVQDETQTLHSATAALNLANDAAQLRYRLDQSTGRDSGKKDGSFLQSIEDHLMEAQLSHIQRCLECKVAQDAGRLAHQRLEEVKRQVEATLLKHLPSDADQPKRELLRGVVFQQLEESGCESMLDALSVMCAELEVARTQKREALATLQAKKERIDQFAKTTETKQALIRKLAKLNSSGKAKIQGQRSELELYVERTVCGHEVELLALGAGLVGMGKAELELFSRIDLRRMVRTPGLSTRSCDLSVHRLHPHHPSGYAGWEGLLGAMQLPLHTSPHALLTHFLDSLDRVESLSSELTHQNDLILKLKQSTVDEASCQASLQGSRDYDKHLRGEGVEQVRRNMLLASQALAQCSVVQETLLEWWEQPAQHCIPWITHDNMALGKWLEQWKVLTAKLTQLSET